MGCLFGIIRSFMGIILLIALYIPLTAIMLLFFPLYCCSDKFNKIISNAMDKTLEIADKILYGKKL